jgi:(R,R)-butanediol dehydrogenase/meso-butanediol dehydrogenase/diacetyl reductase
MRAAMFNGPGRPITIERLPDPEPAAGELLVRVCRCGICGSDVSMSGDAPYSLPLGRIGHEYAGEVIEVGRAVSGFRPGDRVAVMPIEPCHRCAGCRGDNAMFCTAPRHLRGGFGEYMTIPPWAAVPLPQTLSLADGALIEPMACGIHAWRMARMQGGERILVLGAGSVALAMIYWARRLGAGRITVMSRSARRREVALAMGADNVVAFDPDDAAALADALGGPPDIVAECVGKPAMLGQAMTLVRPQGTVLSMGMCMHPEPITPAIGTFKELSLFFPMAYTADEFVETARAFESGGVDPELMVGEVIPLDDLPPTMEALRAGGGKHAKVHVDPRLGG